MKNLYTMLLGIAASFSLQAQSHQFDLPNTSIRLIEGVDTLKNAWAGGLNSPQISEIDANLDGLKDLFMYDRSNDRVSIFLNDGSTSGNPYHYDYEMASHFPPLNAWALLYDYDCDGKEDLFTFSNCNCGIAVYHNTSTGNNLQFTLVDSTLEEQYLSSSINVYATALAVPAFADIDNDGDMDILGYNVIPDGRIQYHRNYSMENWGICDSLNFKFESSMWGFFKLQLGGTNNVGCYVCRTTGQNGEPHVIFNDSTSYYLSYDQSVAAVRDDSNTSIYAIDLDGDNDKELLVGDISSSNTLMVCNGGTPTSALMDSLCTDTLFPSYNTPIILRNFASHAYIDVDNDGLKDLLASPERTENKKCVMFYKNQGTNSVPDFHYQANNFIVKDMMDVGEGASPVFFDQNGDGYPDMVVGNYSEYNSTTHQFKRALALYRSTGTPANPEFTLVTRDFSGVASLLLDGPLYPAFGDLNGDGVDDMMLGCGDGVMHYFTGSGNPITFTLAQANFAGMDVGNASTPQLVDLNNDGKLDLIVGEQGGTLNYFENIGTFSIPNFPSTPTLTNLGGINVRTPGYVDGYSVPFVYYENGKYNLWVSCAMGYVFKYEDITNNIFATWPCTDTLIRPASEGVSLAYNIAASGTYIDSDNVIDMCVGLYGGGVQFFTSINPLGVPSPKLPESFHIYPNPAESTVELKIATTNNKLHARLDLLNSLGQVVLSRMITAPTTLFDVSGLSEGLYIARLENNQGVSVQKLMVSHAGR